MLHAPSGAYRTRKRISKTPAFISKCRKALSRSNPPHQSALPTASPPKGEAFWFGMLPSIQPSLGGRGTDGASRWWMRDASDKLMLPDFVTLTIHRVLKLGIVSQEVRRRSRSDPDHPVNGREGGERAAYVRPVSSSELSYRGYAPIAARHAHSARKKHFSAT